MSGASDKARFHIEQQVPELQELLRKKIFTQKEITSMAKTRSQFEHVLAARGSKPSDYAGYAAYEMNLDTLRRIRLKRMGVKLTGHAGQRKIFFILDRGTRKFPGDLKLWMQLLDFARQQKARKKFKEVMTSVLRLHPVKADLWLYAARWSLEEEGDMTGARGYLQRGLRFCQNDRAVWVEYAKLEVIYITKIAARRKILGLDEETLRRGVISGDEDADTMALPVITAEDINPSLGKEDSLDEVALQNLASTPAFTGAIPMAIFDAAMKHFHHDDELAERFFKMVAEFDQGTTTGKILQHIVESMVHDNPGSVATVACHFSLPLVGIDPMSAEFPMALAEALRFIRTAGIRLVLKRSQIAEVALLRLLPFASNKELDPDVQTVLVSSLRQLVQELSDKNGEGVSVERLMEKLRQLNRTEDARYLSHLLHKQDSYSARPLLTQARTAAAP